MFTHLSQQAQVAGTPAPTDSPLAPYSRRSCLHDSGKFRLHSNHRLSSGSLPNLTQKHPWSLQPCFSTHTQPGCPPATGMQAVPRTVGTHDSWYPRLDIPSFLLGRCLEVELFCPGAPETVKLGSVGPFC